MFPLDQAHIEQIHHVILYSFIHFVENECVGEYSVRNLLSFFLVTGVACLVVCFVHADEVPTIIRLLLIYACQSQPLECD